MNKAKTSHELGQEWENIVAKDIGGKCTPGSGNRSYSILDVDSGLVVVECKHTDAESFRVTPDILDSIAIQVLGPAAASSAHGILAIRLGKTQRKLAVVDWGDLLSWLREPPGLLPSTRQDQLRANARAPSLLR